MRSVPPPKSQSQVTRDFWQWQQEHALSGFSGLEGNDAKFVPEGRLRDYLTKEKIYQLLKAEYNSTNNHSLEQLAKDIVNVDNECFEVFAILVLIGQVHLIKDFTKRQGLHDANLPFSYNQGFPGGLEVYTRFNEIQHRFCVRPKRNMTFTVAEEDILPIKSLEKKGSGSSGQVYKLELHDGYNWASSGGSTPDCLGDQSPPELAIKMFKPQDRDTFRREVEAYEELGPLPNLIHYYGNFTIEGDSGSHNIVLEYADCGTLEDFWSEHGEGCTSAVSFWYFWERFLEVAKPIDRLHFGRPQTADDEQTSKGFHHDIQPRNILVTRDAGPQRHPEDWPYLFKLGDLGLVERVKANGGIATTKDPRVPPIYSAPTCFRKEWQDNWPGTAVQHNDVWSFGCVMSEAFAWSTIGYAALTAYRKKREQAAPGLGPLFHDGSKVLEIVLDYHKHFVNASRRGDRLADEIDRLLRHLLAPGKSRLTMTQFVDHAQQALEEKEPGMGIINGEPRRQSLIAGNRLDGGNEWSDNGIGPIPRSSTVTSQGSTIPPSDLSQQGTILKSDMRRQSTIRNTSGLIRSAISPLEASSAIEGLHSPRSARPPPQISLEQLRDWRESIQRKAPKQLQELHHLKQLRGRDIVFIIDDSETMKRHWNAMRDLVGLLAYAIKAHDKNGLDYLFLSEGKFYNKKDSTPIVEHIHRHKVNCTTPNNANLALQGIFRRYIADYQKGESRQGHMSTMRRLSSRITAREPETCKPITYIILTDAVWYPFPECRVSEPVVRLLRDLGDAASDHQVGISFVQFGSDNHGTRRLQFLDNGLHSRYEVPDVIDYEPHDGNILKMVLGSISPYWDNADDPDARGNEPEWMDG